MLVVLAALAIANEPGSWQEAESAHLRNIRQVTFDFVRAGEGYFSPDGKTIIFQAEEKDTGNPFYQIFTMDLATRQVPRVSPGVGKTTCSFFRPDGKKIIFASSHLDPDAKKHYAEEYQAARGRPKTGQHRRYSWDFDPYMDIFEANPDGTGLKRSDRRQRATTPRAVIRPTASRSSSAPTAAMRRPRAVHHGRRRQERPPADARARLLQRRSVLLARRQTGHLPQRSQGRRTICSCTSSTATAPARRRLDRRPELGALGAVLVQGRQAHHLHRAPTTAIAGAAELRSLLDGHRNGQESADHATLRVPTCCRSSARTTRS